MSASVAAMTMDDQRLNSYNNSKMSKQYEATTNAGHQQNLGPASPEPPQQLHHQQQQHQQEQQSISAEQRNFEAEIETLKAEQLRLAQQFADSQRREKILTRRLANKEQEFQDYVSQIAEYKANQAPSASALRSALLDPAVNLLFEKLKKELKATKAKLEETQNELSAWKFTPDSNTGKRLMAKCRLLYQENEELGKMTSSGRLAKLETELAMQKSFSEEVKKSQSELDDFLQELDEDVEGMQSTILFLQQELKTTRERIQVLEKENFQLKNGGIMADDEININKDNESIESNTNNLTSLQLQHTGLNGNLMMTNNGNTNTNNDNSYQQQNEIKFQNATTTPTTTATAIKLTPIQEEPCVRVKAYTCGGLGNDDSYYNGNTNTDEQQTPLNHDNVAVAGNRTLRTTTARKRAYDSIENEPNAINDTASIPTITTTTPTIISPPTITPPIHQHTITQVVAPPVPRILPPKKSKLRMTPPTIQQDPLTELKDNENIYNAAVPIIESGPMIIDNVIGGTGGGMISNEEITPVNVEELQQQQHAAAAGNGGAPQRIMTRRRSMRTQQNGA